MTLDHARQVKAKHEGRLLKFDYVQGVGIGEDHGEPAIMVYVDRQSATQRDIPERIEDIPIVVEESGGFIAG